MKLRASVLALALSSLTGCGARSVLTGEDDAGARDAAPSTDAVTVDAPSRGPGEFEGLWGGTATQEVVSIDPPSGPIMPTPEPSMLRLRVRAGSPPDDVVMVLGEGEGSACEFRGQRRGSTVTFAPPQRCSPGGRPPSEQPVISLREATATLDDAGTLRLDMTFELDGTAMPTPFRAVFRVRFEGRRVGS